MTQPGGQITRREIAERYGVSDQTVNNWRKHPDWPPPIVQGGPGKAHQWDTDAVEAWWQRHRGPHADLAAALRHVEHQRRIADTRQRRQAERDRVVMAVSRLSREGRTRPEIAAEVGITVDAVHAIRRKYQIDGVYVGRPPTYTDDDIIDALRTAADDSGELSRNTYNQWRAMNQPSAPGQHAICGRFGSWPEALRVAGLTSPSDHPGNLSRRRRWSDDALLDAIRHSGQRTVSGYELAARGNPDMPAVRTIIDRFGSWRSAVQAAG